MHFKIWPYWKKPSVRLAEWLPHSYETDSSLPGPGLSAVAITDWCAADETWAENTVYLSIYICLCMHSTNASYLGLEKILCRMLETFSSLLG